MVEAVVALLLIGLMLIFSLFTLFAYPRLKRGIGQRTEAYRTAEAVLESVRSGQVPMVPGEYDLPRVFPPQDPEANMRIVLRIIDAPEVDLYEIEVQVTYSNGDEDREVTLESLSWSPSR